MFHFKIIIVQLFYMFIKDSPHCFRRHKTHPSSKKASICFQCASGKNIYWPIHFCHHLSFRRSSRNV